MMLAAIAYLYSMKDLSLIDKMDTPFPEEESRAIFKVKDIKQLDKYFKWIKYGRPIDAVKMKLADETDLDPDLLDDPEAEAPPELVPIDFQGNSLYTANSTFKQCFIRISNEEILVQDDKGPLAHNPDSYVPKLPCNDQNQYPECIDYCQWHKKLFNDWTREEFLTVMRYAIPQRKLR